MFGFVIVVVVAPTVVAVAEGVLGLSTVDILTDRFDSLGAFTVICINSALQIRTKPNCELKPFLLSLACVIAFVIVILVTVSQATSSDVPFLPIVLNLKPPPSVIVVIIQLKYDWLKFIIASKWCYLYKISSYHILTNRGSLHLVIN